MIAKKNNLKKRCFISIPIPEDIKDKIEGLYQDINNIRFITRNNLHITVLFLGQIDLIEIERIKKIMQDIKISAFNIKLKGVNVFLKSGILYINIENNNIIKNLNYELVRRINDVIGIDFSEKRGFNAHLTFARYKNIDKEVLKRFIEKYKNLDLGLLECNELDLNESILTRSRAEYKTIFINKLSNNRIIKD
ncbi:MAG: RNA 2',3'-cyclic phosphodiesterase [Candidatus Marsarchaeota archaeon]|nr:RNA 2',3'-cyclic phosphodiesterase [Candidatus Marsarchaeota archaeon]